jgi:hypothetical protein
MTEKDNFPAQDAKLLRGENVQPEIAVKGQGVSDLP